MLSLRAQRNFRILLTPLTYIHVGKVISSRLPRRFTPRNDGIQLFCQEIDPNQLFAI